MNQPIGIFNHLIKQKTFKEYYFELKKYITVKNKTHPSRRIYPSTAWAATLQEKERRGEIPRVLWGIEVNMIQTMKERENGQLPRRSEGSSLPDKRRVGHRHGMEAQGRPQRGTCRHTDPDIVL